MEQKKYSRSFQANYWIKSATCYLYDFSKKSKPVLLLNLLLFYYIPTTSQVMLPPKTIRWFCYLQYRISRIWFYSAQINSNIMTGSWPVRDSRKLHHFRRLEIRLNIYYIWNEADYRMTSCLYMFLTIQWFSLNAHVVSKNDW